MDASHIFSQGMLAGITMIGGVARDEMPIWFFTATQHCLLTLVLMATLIAFINAAI